MGSYAAKASSGVRDLHVLPFISKFAIISHHIEIMLADRHIRAGGSVGLHSQVHIAHA
jgi:hypothetical protein